VKAGNASKFARIAGNQCRLHTSCVCGNEEIHGADALSSAFEVSPDHAVMHRSLRVKGNDAEQTQEIFEHFSLDNVGRVAFDSGPQFRADDCGQAAIRRSWQRAPGASAQDFDADAGVEQVKGHCSVLPVERAFLVTFCASDTRKTPGSGMTRFQIARHIGQCFEPATSDRRKDDGAPTPLNRDFAAFEAKFLWQPHGLTSAVLKELCHLHIYIM